MAKGTKLSEFEKDEITALKKVGKSQREISKALGHSKTVICNHLKSPNKYTTSSPRLRQTQHSIKPRRRRIDTQVPNHLSTKYAMSAATLRSLAPIVKMPLNRQSPIYLPQSMCYSVGKKTDR